MKRAAGHAGLFLGRILHDLSRILFLLLLLALLSVCALAFRLSQGPLDIPGLASRLATAVSGEGVHVEVRQAALAWGGWRQGGVPFYLQLGDINITNAAGRGLARIAEARLVAAPEALFGRGAPILVESHNARLAGASVPVALVASIRLSHAHFATADLAFTLGAGEITGGPALGSGFFLLHVTPSAVVLRDGTLHLAPHGASAPVVTLTGAGTRGAVWSGVLTIRVDTLQAPDLGAYWPANLAPATRHWVVTNLTAGTAEAARFQFGLAAPPTLASLRLTSSSGGFAAQGVSLGWLPHAQPITNLIGQFTLQDRHTIVITGQSASLGGVSLTDGVFTISGVGAHHQTGTLALNLGGRLQDALAVLNAPPLRLLRRAPPSVAAATGLVTGHLTLTLPFSKHMRFVDTPLLVQARLTDVILATPLTGLEFTYTSLALTAENDGLMINGAGLFAGQPAIVSAKVVFAAHPALQAFGMTSQAGPFVLHHFGLDAPGMFTGPVQGVAPFTVAFSPAAGDVQNADIQADLSPVALALPRFGWSKPAGAAASLDLRLLVPADGAVSVTSVSAAGPGLLVQAQADGPRLHVRRAEIGRTSATGFVTPPTAKAGWVVAFSGSRLYYILQPKVPPEAAAGGKAPAKQAVPAPPAQPGPAWRLALAFTQATLAAGAPPFDGLSLSASGQGGTVLAARFTAQNPATLLTITPDGRERGVSLVTPDGGTLLRALGLYGGLQGGALSLAATTSAGTTSGTLTLDRFRLSHAPEFAKVLQALSIYGVAAATSGPGLAFKHLVAPFSLTPSLLTLENASAYSPSLGFTASGTVALPSNIADLNTTIIPAYAINVLPGEVPVIGHLLTAEKGGGLISIRVHITGPLSDPSVMFNPLSALTPGVLRDVFGTANKSK